LVACDPDPDQEVKLIWVHGEAEVLLDGQLWIPTSKLLNVRTPTVYEPESPGPDEVSLPVQTGGAPGNLRNGKGKGHPGVPPPPPPPLGQRPAQDGPHDPATDPALQNLVSHDASALHEGRLKLHERGFGRHY
jgi:hypothetical protein